MRYRRGSDVVYRNGGYLVTAVLAGVWWIVGSIVAGRAGWAFAGLLVVPGAVYLNLKLRVVLSDPGVRIHVYGSTERVPYESITAARFTGRRAGHRFLEIYLTDGSRVGVHGSRASFFPFHYPGWQRPLADEVMDRAGHARNDEDDVALPAELRDVIADGAPAQQPVWNSRSDREREDRIRLVFAVAAGVTIWVLAVLLFMDQPLPFLGESVWLVAAVLAATFAVRFFWQRVVTRIPARFAESQSTPIRMLTTVVKVYATALVGVLALAVVFDVPTFIIQHL